MHHSWRPSASRGAGRDWAIKQLPQQSTLIAGGMGGVAGGLACDPADVVQTCCLCLACDFCVSCRRVACRPACDPADVLPSSLPGRIGDQKHNKSHRQVTGNTSARQACLAELETRSTTKVTGKSQATRLHDICRVTGRPTGITSA